MHPEIARIRDLLEVGGYIADRTIATSVYLSTELRKPLLIEGAAGVGKTEVAKVMARALQADLIRLQCYEGLDATTALYEWNYQKQLLHIRISEGNNRPLDEREAEIFGQPFLLKRPLLDAITRAQPPVLLVDEIDRADEEFEAFLLEVLSDFQVTIPEIGTISATAVPYVVLTSNRTRELGDALRRRCLYLWIDYPTFEKEIEIVRRKVPTISAHLAEQIGAFMQMVRRIRLEKTPGVAETLDWSAALLALHRDHLDRDAVLETLGALFKHHDDAAAVRSQWLGLLLDGIAALEERGEPWSHEAVAEAAERLPVRP